MKSVFYPKKLKNIATLSTKQAWALSVYKKVEIFFFVWKFKLLILHIKLLLNFLANVVIRCAPGRVLSGLRNLKNSILNSFLHLYNLPLAQIIASILPYFYEIVEAKMASKVRGGLITYGLCHVSFSKSERHLFTFNINPM